MGECPGFIDLQVNGYGGVDFSRVGLTVEGVRRCVEGLVARGTVGFCATIVTSGLEVYEENLPVLARAMGEAGIREHVLGIHLEGPFISGEDGARGGHRREHVRKGDVELVRRWQELAGGKIRLMTVAPEVEGVLEVIEAARENGITVSVGHSGATEGEVAAAVAAGARACTHVGNAVGRVMAVRESAIFYELTCRELAVMLITDGYHLPRSFLVAAVRLAGPERVIVVSDVAPVAGLDVGEYEFLGERVIVEESGRVYCPRTGKLAGSGLTMLECMNVLAGTGELDEAGLWRAGFYNALNLIGEDAARFWGMARRVRFESGKFIVT
ncbi:MAG: amidohydrolase family protein [bacterium]|nr:amidohydrolase family protein [bacterium]